MKNLSFTQKQIVDAANQLTLLGKKINGNSLREVIGSGRKSNLVREYTLLLEKEPELFIQADDNNSLSTLVQLLKDNRDATNVIATMKSDLSAVKVTLCETKSELETVRTELFDVNKKLDLITEFLSSSTFNVPELPEVPFETVSAECDVCDDVTDSIMLSASPDSKIGVSTIKWGEHYLTLEQENALILSKNGKWLKVEAYAGSGKTTLLNIISTLALADKKVLYIAFNRAIVDEASRAFPRNVVAKTTHSLAAADVVAWGGRKKKGDGRFDSNRLGVLNGNYLAKVFGIKRGVACLTNVGLCNYAAEIVSKFCGSADKTITQKHSYSEIFDQILDKDVQKRVKEAGVKLAKKFWERMSDVEDDVTISHDVYLKVWALTRPNLGRYDVILFDEAQDANPLILDVVARQKTTQNIFVGDRYQQIYSWRGAVNAMSTIKTDLYANISQSFRFGTKIADLASTVLSHAYDEKITIRGFDKINSKICRIAKPKAVITRTNALLINELLKVVNPNTVVAIEGGIKPLITLLCGARDLMNGKRTAVAELATFENWEQVEEYAETPMGGSLKTLVKLVERGVDDIISDLERCKTVQNAADADIIFTTAHKSKGKEYRSVKLGSDFRTIKKGSKSEEANLLYVALTRATHELDIEDCEAIDRILNPKKYEK